MAALCEEFYRSLRRPGDSADDENLRRLILPVGSFFAFLSGCGVAYRSDRPGTYMAGCAIVCAVCIFLTVYIVMRIPGSYVTLMSVSLLPALVGVLTIDLADASVLTVRLWPTIVIIMDILVVINASLRVQMAVVVVTLVYITVIGVESYVLFGLYDLGKAGDSEVRACSCSEPPCPVGVFAAVITWGVETCVFSVDFYITRGFATGLRRQMEINELTVEVAEKVAQLLADYAIEEAREVVAADGQKLSKGLADAFSQLLDNLERYRAFLPPGLWADSAGDCQEDEHDDTDDKHAQVLPQLAVPQMRRAVEVVWSQAILLCRDTAEQVITGALNVCIAASDVAGAQHLLHLGWAAPATLADKVRDMARRRTSARAYSKEQQREPRLSLSISGAPSAPQNAREVKGRFGDGADDPSASLVAAALWPAGYDPPPPVLAVRDMSQWHDTTGDCHWSSEAVQHMICDQRTLLKDVDPGQNMLALYVYTIEFHEPVVWAIWLGGRWRPCDNQDQKLDPVTHSLQLEAGLRRDLGVGQHSRCAPELLLESPHGVSIYHVEGEPRLLRYENNRRGDPEASPLNDTILWTPGPKRIIAPDGMFSATREQYAQVPPGILEFITSRSFTGSCSRRDWESLPLDLFRNLHEQCMAQKNQQRPKECLCQMAKAAFQSGASDLSGFRVPAAQLAAVLPVLYQAKCPSPSPTPVQIAHACELGLLRWQSSYAVVALTGGPRIAVPLSEGTLSAVQLWRVDQASSAQPYLLMNNAIRCQQLGDRDARLIISGHVVPYYASQPAAPPPAPEAAVFCGPAGRAQWQGKHWAVTLTGNHRVEEHHGEVTSQGWGLAQYRAVIWHVDSNLAGMEPLDSNGARSKGYRGLQGVALSRAIYSRGKVVMFPAFTSTSSDQGVAAGFAQGEGAAVVFTTYTTSGRLISAWSRYGREKEVLLRLNTLHLVTDALSAEHAAIVDKEALQVFDLRELTPAEAARHLAKEGALAMSGEHPSMLQQAKSAAANAEHREWATALEQLLVNPADAVTGGGEGRFVRSVLPKSPVGIVVLVLSSPDGHEIGAAVDPWLWNSFFEEAEVRGQNCGARLTTTSLGHIMALVTAGGSEAVAQTAVGLALDLVGGVQSPGRAVGPRGRRLTRRNLGASVGGGEQALQVHCGVSVGTVHSGFGGSAMHRVQIADGPAVRRAFRMAAYALRHGVTEAVTDAGCAAAAAVDHITWTMDLVSFDSKRDLREPITCVENRGQAGAMGAAAAQSIQEAWGLVEAAAESADAVARRVRERVEGLHPGAALHRAAKALQDAVEEPSTYCYDLEGT